MSLVGPGARKKPIPILGIRVLAKPDLAKLNQPRGHSVTLRLRESHHEVARLAALGMDGVQIAKVTGYSNSRIGVLMTAPAMKELIAQYRNKVDSTFVEAQEGYYTLLTNNMVAAERHIADHIAELDEQSELLPINTALKIARDAADRTGFGKKETRTNVNVDFAKVLEARVRERRLAQAGPTDQSQGSSSYKQPLVIDAQPLRVSRRV